VRLRLCAFACGSPHLSARLRALVDVLLLHAVVDVAESFVEQCDEKVEEQDVGEDYVREGKQARQP
jgi:hypothetical protein